MDNYYKSPKATTSEWNLNILQSKKIPFITIKLFDIQVATILYRIW
jgi:hypothetical protein